LKKPGGPAANRQAPQTLKKLNHKNLFFNRGIKEEIL